MNEEIKITEVEQLDDVVQEENQQPVIIQPKIIPPRVLLEVLVYGCFTPGTDPKESETYLETALVLQKQIDALRGKNKYRVRILWKMLEADYNNFSWENEDDLVKWLIENSSCKYWILAPHKPEENFIKQSLKEIKKFEGALEDFKHTGITLKRK
jgi:hypothetical protein